MTAADAAKVVPLMAELGYPTDAFSLAQRISDVLSNPSDRILVAEEDGTIQGLCAVHSFEMLHQPGRLGRITALVVSSPFRGRGVGGRLLRAAEDHLRAGGCMKLEVTSAEHRPDAHGFYAAHGHAEQRVRFVKTPVKLDQKEGEPT